MSLGHGSTIVRDGLVLHLDAANKKSYPGTGTTWYDISGNNISASLMNGVNYDGTSMSFNGIDGYATFNTEYAFNTGNGVNYTFEIWFKMRTLPVSQYQSNGHIWGGENGNDVVIYLNPAVNGISKGVMVYDDTRYLESMMTTGGFTADTWSQWVIVGNGSNNTVTHYINGKLDKENGIVSPDTQYVKPWSGTRMAYDNRWLTYSELDLSIAKQYNRALSADEILQNFNASRGRYGL